jgi:hypothetical protein
MIFGARARAFAALACLMPLFFVAESPLSRRLFRQQVCKGLFPLLGRLSHTLKKDR